MRTCSSREPATKARQASPLPDGYFSNMLELYMTPRTPKSNFCPRTEELKGRGRNVDGTPFTAAKRVPRRAHQVALPRLSWQNRSTMAGLALPPDDGP